MVDLIRRQRHLPKGERTAAAAALVPDAYRLLVETDAPYLTPQLHRRERNTPARVVHTAEFVAEQRGVDYASFDRWSSATRPICSVVSAVVAETEGDLPVQPSLRRIREFNVRPKHDLGQNFLIDSNILGVIDRLAGSGRMTLCSRSAEASAS